MKFNRNEHSRFVQWLDKTAEKNPLLWLPCILLIALALAGEHIAEYVRIMYSHRKTEKVVKKKPQLERKPFALRVVAMSLVVALGVMFTPDFDGIIGFNAFADDEVDFALGDSNNITLLATNENSLASGQCGYDMYWNLSNEGILTISGTGAMYDFNYEDTIIGSDYRKQSLDKEVKKVVMEDGILSIGSYAFCDFVNLTDVEFSDDIISIHSHAFDECKKLSSIIIPNSCVQICDHAFSFCDQLSEIKLSDNLIYIEQLAFWSCSNLKNFIMPNSVQHIGMRAFDNCDSLTEIVIPENITFLGSTAFSSCDNLEKVTIPKSITDLKGAFNFCHNIKTVYGYYGTAAEDFARKKGLDFISLDDNKCGENAYWKLSDDGTLIISGYGDMYDYSFGAGAEEQVPPWYEYREQISNITFSTDSDLTIGKAAFQGIPNVKEIVIPENVTAIKSYAFLNCGISKITIMNPNAIIEDYAIGFNGTPSLNNLETSFITVYGHKHSTAANLQNVYGSGNIFVALDADTKCGDDAYWSISDTGVLNISGSGEIYDYRHYVEYAPWGSNPTKVIINEGITKIGYDNFHDCPDLLSILIPESVTEISNFAFSWSSNKLTIYGYLGSTAETYAKENNIKFIDIDSQWISNCSFAFSESPISIKEGMTKTISAICSDNDIVGVNFQMRDGSIASITRQYCDETKAYHIDLAANKIGTTEIDAYIGHTLIASVHVKVVSLSDIDVEKSTLIDMRRESYELYCGQTTYVNFEYLGSDKVTNVALSSENDGIIEFAEYDPPLENRNPFIETIQVKVTALSEGETKLFITINDEHTSYIFFNVKRSEKEIIVSSDRPGLTIGVGEEVKILADVMQNGKSCESDLTFACDDGLKIINLPEWVWTATKEDKVIYIKALNSGTHKLTIVDNINNLIKIVPITVEPQIGNSYTVYNVPVINDDLDTNFIINGMYIDSFKKRFIENDGKTTCKVEFDVYNTLNIYGIVEIYDADSNLVDAELIESEKSMPTSIVESTWNNLKDLGYDIVSGQVLTYRQQSGYSEHTHIEISNIPLGGYIVITNNSMQSLPLYIINGVDLVLSYKDFGKMSWKSFENIKTNLAKELTKKLPAIINEKLLSGDIPQDFNKKLYKNIKADFVNKGSFLDIHVSGDFVGTFVNWLNDINLADIIWKTAKSVGISTAEEIFIRNAGFVAAGFDICFGISRGVNLITKINDFTNSLNESSRWIHVPIDGRASCANVTVYGDFDDFTSLNVIQISADESIINNISDIEQNDKKLAYTYEISLYKNGKEVQPEGMITIRIKIPKELLPYKNYLKITRVENNGNVITLSGKVENDELIFTTNHFSYYVLYVSNSEHIHSFSSGWNQDKTGHWHECTICGEHFDTEQHNENNVVDSVKPTAMTAGTRTYYCSVCGYAVRTETIPPINDPNPPYPTYPTYPTITYPTNTDTNTIASNEPYIYGDTLKSGWDAIISEIDFTADGSTVRVNMNGTYELPKDVVSRIQNRNINLELHCGGAVWTINGLDVTNPKTVNMRVSDRYNKIPASVIDGLNSELTAKELRLYHNGDFGFKATLTVGVGKKYNNYYGALYHYNTKTKQLDFVDESLAADRQITFELTHASYYAVAFNSVPLYDDISSGAGVTADSIPIDFAIPTSDGVTIPAIKLPQIMKYSSKKRRYRILKKRRLDDLVFVL